MTGLVIIYVWIVQVCPASIVNGHNQLANTKFTKPVILISKSSSKSCKTEGREHPLEPN